MATTTWTAGRKRILEELDVGVFVPNADISALVAGSFTAPNIYQDPVMAPDFLQIRNTGIIRGGAATSADFWRPAGTINIATGLVANAGQVWADSTLTTEDFELWYYRVRPHRELLASLNRVLIKEFVTTYLAVSHLSRVDGDMALSTDTNWTDVGTPTTSAKAQTAQRTPWGLNNYHLVADAVGEGTQSPSILTRAGCNVSGHTIIAADSGAVSFHFRDVTGTADIGTAVTHSERRPQLMSIRNQVTPSTCEVVALRALSTENPTDFYVNQMWLYNLDNPICPLPALISESFMAPKIIQAVPTSSTSTGAYDAESFDFRTLVEGVDYWLVINQADAQPYKVRFADTSYYEWPLFVEARIPQSALVTVAGETDAFWDQAKIIPRWKKDLLETVYSTGSRRHPDWDRQYNLAQLQLTEAGKARQKESIAPAREVWRPMLNA